MEKKKCKSKEEAYEALACQVMKELNTQDMQAFLLTHRLFATPCTDLGALWVKMFKKITSTSKEKDVESTEKEGMLNFLRIWISSYYKEDSAFIQRNKLLHYTTKEKTDLDTANGFKLLLLKQKSSSFIQRAPTISHSSSSLGSSTPKGTSIPSYFSTSSITPSPLSLSSSPLSSSNSTPVPSILDNPLSPRATLGSSGLPALATASLSSLLPALESLVSPRQKQESLPSILDFSSTAIARELTLMEFELFSCITPRELVHFQDPSQAPKRCLSAPSGFSEADSPESETLHAHRNAHNPSKSDLPESIARLVNHFNCIANWVAQEIITQQEKKRQSQVLKRFIKIGSKCLKINNFNAAMEISAGLNGSSVQRLKQVWNELPENVAASFSQIDTITNPGKNYYNYRTELKKQERPSLPYFGLILRDFTFIYENPKHLEDGSINTSLVHLLAEQVKEVQQHQKNHYNFDSNPTIRKYIQNLRPIQDEEELYNLSIKSQASAGQDQQSGNKLSLAFASRRKPSEDVKFLSPRHKSHSDPNIMHVVVNPAYLPTQQRRSSFGKPPSPQSSSEELSPIEKKRKNSLRLFKEAQTDAVNAVLSNPVPSSSNGIMISMLSNVSGKISTKKKERRRSSSGGASNIGIGKPKKVLCDELERNNPEQAVAVFGMTRRDSLV